MAFPQRFMDELAARNDIVDVVGSYVTLTPKGGSYWACCPFHNEKTPSFHVQPDKQMYYCFGCKKGGDVISFIMEEESLPFPDAVRFLAKRAGMTVPEEDGDRRQAYLRARMLSLNRDAARFYYQILGSDAGRFVRDYLIERRISPKIATKFGLGASPKAQDALMLAMIQKGYDKRELLAAGLIVDNKRGGFYDKFRNRLMLPVIDVRGDVVGFGSRALDKESKPKYMNSPDTLVYDKSKVLYGFNLAIKTKRPNFVLCEGNLDVVTLHQAGFDNAFATMGTALTVDQQTKQIGRYIRNRELILCFDSDSAGRAATEKSLKSLTNANYPVRVVPIPSRLVDGELVKQDPDDFIKYQGPDAFERLLLNSETGMDFRMEQIAGKYDLRSDEGRLAYSAEAKDLIASMQSSVGRDIYIQKAAEAAGVAREAMAADVQRAAKDRFRKDRKTEERRSLNPVMNLIQPQDRSLRYVNPRSARAEEQVIHLLLSDDRLSPDSGVLTEEQFSVPLYGRVFTLLRHAREAGRTGGLGVLTGELSQEEMSQIVSVCQQPMSGSGVEQAMADCLRIIREEADRRGADYDPLRAAMGRAAHKRKSHGRGEGT